MKSYTHCPSTESKAITLCKRWIEAEIQLFPKALMKESLRVPEGNLWRMARDGEKTEN